MCPAATQLRELSQIRLGFYRGEINLRDTSRRYAGFVPFYVDLLEGKVSIPPRGRPLLRAMTLSDIVKRCRDA